MTFLSGESGNPGGRPVGSKNKRRCLLADLDEHGLNLPSEAIALYRLALAGGDLRTAARLMTEWLKLVYPAPVADEASTGQDLAPLFEFIAKERAGENEAG